MPVGTPWPMWRATLKYHALTSQGFPSKSFTEMPIQEEDLHFRAFQLPHEECSSILPGMFRACYLPVFICAAPPAKSPWSLRRSWKCYRKWSHAARGSNYTSPPPWKPSGSFPVLCFFCFYHQSFLQVGVLQPWHAFRRSLFIFVELL